MSEHWSYPFRREGELHRWALPFASPELAWEACPRADWLLWALSRSGAHRPTLVLCAADCARLTLARAPEDEGLLAAIERAEDWAAGKVSGRACEQAAAFARGGRPAAGAAAATAEAASYAAHCWDGPDGRLDHALSEAASLAASALARDGVPIDLHHQELIQRIRVRDFPLRAPSLTEIRRSDALAVAWDRLCEEVDEDATLSAAQALCSFSVALTLGFEIARPVDPDSLVLRAVAERLQLAPHLLPLVRQAIVAAQPRSNG